MRKRKSPCGARSSFGLEILPDDVSKRNVRHRHFVRVHKGKCGFRDLLEPSVQIDREKSDTDHCDTVRNDETGLCLITHVVPFFASY